MLLLRRQDGESALGGWCMVAGTAGREFGCGWVPVDSERSWLAVVVA